jgi:hypothetical protein
VCYSCRLCGLERVRVEVPARGEEPIATWLPATVRRLCADHDRRSPACHPTTLSEVLIPMTGAARVGGPAEH